jgi:predicted Zn-dependent protease
VDTALAEATHRQLLASGLVVRDGAAREAVQRIGDRLLTAAPPHPFRFRFEVLQDPTVNAFAVPGGLVVVHAGLVADARMPDELAGVLAHEITHVLERHSLRQLLFQLGLRTSLGLLLGLPDGVADAVGTAAANLGGLQFSRDQEREADGGAVELLARARLPAAGLESFFERLARQEGRGLAIVSTHPPSAERAAALRRLLVERGTWPTDPLALDWERVRQDGAARGAGRPAQS